MTSIAIANKRTRRCNAEEIEFSVKIEDFQQKMQNRDWRTVYDFQCGDSIGLPTNWHLTFGTFVTTYNFRRLGYSLQLRESPEEVRSVKAALGLKTLKDENKMYCPVLYALNVEKEWDDLLGSCESSLEADGSLRIQVQLTLYYDPMEDGETQGYKRIKLDNQSRIAVAEDLQKLLDSEENADLTITTMDGQPIKAHRAILSTRSPIFYAMFHHQLTESTTGILNIIDISSEGMKAILHYIYTGTLMANWVELLHEIVYAAKKYQLLALIEMCDRNLASMCTPDNAWDHFESAHLHELKIAGSQIEAYIETHIREIFEAKKSALDQQK